MLMRLMRSIFKIYYQILKYIIILVDNMPRKIKKSIDDIITSLYVIVNHYKEIQDLEDQLNQEKHLINEHFKRNLNDLEFMLNKISKL